MLQIKRYASKKETQQKAAERLHQILDAHSHVPILFLSSGGSSLELLERIWAFPLNFTVGMTDDRFSKDPKINNFAQLCKTLFFQKAKEHKTHFIDTRVRMGEDIESLSKRFESALDEWKKVHPEGRVVITQGVGVNSHTLGIMPYPANKDIFYQLFEGDHWVRGYDAQERSEYPLRVTITLPFLRQVDHCVAYMAGEEKKQALSRTLKAEGTLWETPSRIMHEMKEVILFTDIEE
jgi:6-phosphogluconolactonase/glucosamine-6-phosphate isomerase/deaminase